MELCWHSHSDFCDFHFSRRAPHLIHEFPRRILRCQCFGFWQQSLTLCSFFYCHVMCYDYTFKLLFCTFQFEQGFHDYVLESIACQLNHKRSRGVRISSPLPNRKMWRMSSSDTPICKQELNICRQNDISALLQSSALRASCSGTLYSTTLLRRLSLSRCSAAWALVSCSEIWTCWTLPVTLSNDSSTCFFQSSFSLLIILSCLLKTLHIHLPSVVHRPLLDVWRDLSISDLTDLLTVLIYYGNFLPKFSYYLILVAILLFLLVLCLLLRMLNSNFFITDHRIVISG